MTRTAHALGALGALCLTTPVFGQDSAPTSPPSLVSTPVAAATPFASLYPATAIGDSPLINGYSLSRWTEDWRGMADKARRDDPLDRLKFIPLDSDGDVYLTFSGEVRLRVNHTTNPGLREAPAQRQDINRLIAGTDLHIGRHLRAYAEIAHGGISGVELGVPPATLRNTVVIQQSFIEGDVRLGGVDLGVRYGRQEFTDGPNLLLSQRDNNTIRYTLNGLRLWARTGTVRVDLFDMKPTAYGDLGTDDDIADPNRRFSGLTMGIALPKRWFGGSKLYVEPFLWRRRNYVGAWGGRVGPARRYYGGARMWGEMGPLTIDWSANHQWGEYLDQKISAWQVFMIPSYKLGHSANAPKIGTHFTYASGGGGYGDGKLRDAYAPYGNNIFYSYALFLTPSNLIAAGVNLTVTPIRPVKLTGEYIAAWRDDADDAVYRANGMPFAGTQNVAGAKIADVLRAQAIWTISPRLSFTGRYEHLIAGPVLTRAGYKNSDFLAGWISFRF